MQGGWARGEGEDTCEHAPTDLQVWVDGGCRRWVFKFGRETWTRLQIPGEEDEEDEEDAFTLMRIFKNLCAEARWIFYSIPPLVPPFTMREIFARVKFEEANRGSTA
ncbi:hypothetical protein ACLOJK_007292 [Asimina triloba]